MERSESSLAPAKALRSALAVFMAVVLCMTLTPGAALASQQESSEGAFAAAAVEGLGEQTVAADAYAAAAAAVPAAKAKSIAKAKLTLSKSSYVYSGKQCKPSVTVKLSGKKLKKGTHYTVAYQNNVKAGKATVVVTGKGAYAGTAKKTFKIAKKSLSKAKVSLSKSTYRYNWTACKPGVTVKLSGKKLKNGTDYKVTYKNNAKVGKATVVVTAKGSYSGRLTKSFTITDPIAKSWMGVSMAAEETGGRLLNIPYTMQSKSLLSFTASTSKACKVTVNSHRWSGKWAFHRTRSGMRCYNISFSDGSRWYAGLAKDGSLIMTDKSNTDYTLRFE